jgi:hypothetical protein
VRGSAPELDALRHRTKQVLAPLVDGLRASRR